MKPNEDRIWDILIEDALREGGVDQSAQPVGDHTRRLLTPVGAPGFDRGRSLREPSRRKWLPASVSVALLLLVAAILYAGVEFLPYLAETRTDQPQAAEEDQKPHPKRPNNTTPAPKPEPQPNDTGPVEQPDDIGPIQPEPKDPIEQPKPEPKPDETVEQPKPKPDDTIEQPRPEPKPDDTVEQPKEPEGTTPEPDSKPRINLLTKFDWTKRDSKELLYSTDGQSWLSTRYLSDFKADTWFRATWPVHFEAGGVSLILEGEVHVTLTDESLTVDLVDDELYLDSRGANHATAIVVDGETLSLTSGEVYLCDSRTDTDICVYDGELLFNDSVITQGQHGMLKGSRFTPSRKPMQERAEFPLLRDLKERVTYRENFDADPKGRLREGELKDGVISGPTVFWGYPENVVYKPGMVIRLRVRFTGAEAATLTQFNPMQNDNYSHELNMDTGLLLDTWYLLEVPVDKFLDRTTHKVNPKEPDLFQNVSIQLKGEKAQVELDWVELIRAVK